MKKMLAAFAGMAVAAAAANAAVFNVTLNNVDSNDPYGSPLNVVEIVNTAMANGHVVSIGWDVTIYADSPSWLSELAVAFENSSQSNGVFLNPGFGDDFSGTSSYTSGGLLDLIGLGLDFNLDADGLLRLEFFEDFDDFPNDWDGIWISGTLSIEVLDVPAPSAFAMLGLAGLAATRRRR
ncbi:MAG: PEP-CTERM sorting domain-containing protein [Phycisphaerae bacterium]|nr:PEP-CTERM sorting domain-containing protein [Phycisphaerae bacterium]MBN8598840.1 PEP-CTERM sorting domain-containing protein [Planctomycetota bacterium]